MERHGDNERMKLLTSPSANECVQQAVLEVSGVMPVVANDTIG